MAVIKKGVSEALQKPEISLIPGVGIRFVTRKEFMSHESAYAYARSLFDQGYRVDLKQKGEAPIWVVEGTLENDPTDPGGDSGADLQNTHELRVNVLNPDLKSNLVLQAQFSASGAAAAISFVEKQANKIKAGEKTRQDVIDGWIVDTDSPIQVPDDVAATSLLDLILLGTDSFVTFQYVYTHTFNFGSLRDLSADFSGVGQIFSTSGVRSAEDVPSIFDLPSGEWLKLPPEKTVMFGGRASLKYEYWWAEEWSRMLYATA